MWEPIANDLYGPLGHAGRLDTRAPPSETPTRVASRSFRVTCDLCLAARVARLVFREVGIGRSVANSVP